MVIQNLGIRQIFSYIQEKQIYEVFREFKELNAICFLIQRILVITF